MKKIILFAIILIAIPMLISCSVNTETKIELGGVVLGSINSTKAFDTTVGEMEGKVLVLATDDQKVHGLIFISNEPFQEESHKRFIKNIEKEYDIQLSEDKEDWLFYSSTKNNVKYTVVKEESTFAISDIKLTKEKIANDAIQK